MATRGRKAAKRTTAHKRTRPIRKPKPARAKSASRTARSKPERLKSTAPKSGKPAAGKSRSGTATLKRQLRVAQDRQTASAEILRTIGNVSGDAERSLFEIAGITKRLFEASSVSIFVAEGDKWRQVIHDGASSERISAEVPADQLRIGSHSLPGATFSENRQIHLPDLNHVDPAIADWPGVRPARAAGSRTISGTPLRRAGEAVGVLIVHRNRLAPFTADELALLQSFADQAAIAIYNARLFNEVQAKTRDLTEALTYQTGSSNILKVIASSPTDVGPVLKAIVESACELCEANDAVLHLREGNTMRHRAHHGPTPVGFEALPISRDLVSGRAVIEKAAIHLRDVLSAEGDGFSETQRMSRTLGTRTILGVPLLRENESIGAIVLRRSEVNPFSEKQIALLQTFANQAVIAIENVRLFNDTQEALERQTASADILKVIASSPSDVQPVFNAVVLTARRLLGREMAAILLCGDGATFRAVAGAGPDGLIPIDPIFAAPTKIDPEANFPSRAIVSKKNQHLPDWSAIDLPEEERNIREMVGWNSTLYLPMLRGDECIGVLLLGGTQPGIFSEADIALAESFRDQAVIAIENARLFNETKEALERQTATSDILNVIASSPTDTQPVFDAIARSAAKLCEGTNSGVFRLRDGIVHLAGHHNLSPEQLASAPKAFPAPLHRGFMAGRAIIDRAVAHVPDIAADPEYSAESIVKAGFRSAVSVPMLRNGEPIGAINVTREEARPFSEAQVELLKSFADQAVIAIENTRLFNETQEALERQTATAEILRVISQSPTDVQPVFDAIVLTAVRLFKRNRSFILSCDGATYWPVALAGPDGLLPFPDLAPEPIDPDANFPSRAIVTRKNLHLPDWSTIDLPEYERRIHDTFGFNSALYLPLLREGECIGILGIAGTRAGTFDDNEIALAESFRDQAVIAIENVRLFNETREALERQTATADILKVIANSPDDVQPVFKAIAASANALLGGFSTAVFRFVDDIAHLAAFTPTNPAADSVLQSSFPMPLTDYEPFELAKTGQPTEITDTEEMPNRQVQEIARMRGFRSMLFVPLMSSEGPIGLISVTRTETGSFAGHHVQLLRTFADQAVIAIENVRLFDEVQAKTRDLTESLQQQTATADVLQVISNSVADPVPVFDKILDACGRLFNGVDMMVFLVENDEILSLGAIRGLDPDRIERVRRFHPRPLAGTVTELAIRERRLVTFGDVFNDPGVPEGLQRVAAEVGESYSIAIAPMLWEDRGVGAIIVSRFAPLRSFDAAEQRLLQTFADQAVIAIQNADLFNEAQARTRELSASLDNLRTAQDRLVQTEKLASLGQLTAGIAHEIKNPLNFVNNFSALSAELTDELNDALRPVALDDKVRKEVEELTRMLKDNLEKVVQHGKRADSIVKNMLLHSREGSGEQRPADINTLLDESLNLAYHGARAEKSAFNITLQRDFDADAGEVELFPQEITRAFLNFISNGFYAATKRKIENGDPGFEPLLAAATRNLGDSVEIRIRDNGTGIPAEVREKMFNPFFTTKPAGEGTGLGLSMSHDIIVKQHGGSIDVETEPGQFTELRIVLPRGGRR
jgi:GAF domain-containing protein/anti-sigma regulatory factor (Ser/Thr protein kinase)